MIMADRIVVLNEGPVAQIGAPLELYDEPDHLFVAGFIGSPTIGILRGRPRCDNGKACVEIDRGVRLAVPTGVAATPGTEVICGMRSEHLARADGSAALEGTVEVVEQTGLDVLVFERFSGHRICGLFRDGQGTVPG
jgi:multiple sugar transport system ATP-binding protein